MDRYLVVWLREGRENVDVIDNAIRMKRLIR